MPNPNPGDARQHTEADRQLAAVDALADALAAAGDEVRLGGTAAAALIRNAMLGTRFTRESLLGAVNRRRTADPAADNLDDLVVELVRSVGADGATSEWLLRLLAHRPTAPRPHELSAALVRLSRHETNPTGPLVLLNGRWYAVEHAPATGHNRGRGAISGPLAATHPDAHTLAAIAGQAMDCLAAAGTSGADADELVATLATRGVPVDRNAVVMALGFAAAGSDSVRQPKPHGPYYLTRYAPAT